MPRKFTLEHIVNTTPENAKGYFADFRKFSALHPLFVGMEQVDETHFIIREKMPVTHIKFKYKATVIHKKETNEVVYIAYPFFLTLTLSFVFHPGPTENSCKIIEQVNIKGPMIISDILKSLIKKMHPLLIEKLNSKL